MDVERGGLRLLGLGIDGGKDRAAGFSGRFARGTRLLVGAHLDNSFKFPVWVRLGGFQPANRARVSSGEELEFAVGGGDERR